MHSGFHLSHEIFVRLKVVEHYGVVDVADTDIIVVELFSPHHVLVAISAESLVEWYLYQYIPTGNEI